MNKFYFWLACDHQRCTELLRYLNHVPELQAAMLLAPFVRRGCFLWVRLTFNEKKSEGVIIYNIVSYLYAYLGNQVGYTNL